MKIEIDTRDMAITPEMRKHFLNYLRNHQRRVIQNANLLYRLGYITIGLRSKIAAEHDVSKTQEPEYFPYVKRKCLEKMDGANYREMGDDVKDAIVHHVTTNDHHPEYWSDDYAGFDSNKPCHITDMPEECVVEMVCDWVAMGQELGNTARQWYDSVKDRRWIFDDVTTERIEYWLSVFEKYHWGEII